MWQAHWLYLQFSKFIIGQFDFNLFLIINLYTTSFFFLCHRNLICTSPINDRMKEREKLGKETTQYQTTAICLRMMEKQNKTKQQKGESWHRKIYEENDLRRL